MWYPQFSFNASTGTDLIRARDGVWPIKLMIKAAYQVFEFEFV